MNTMTKNEKEGSAATERIQYLIPTVNVYETEEGYLLEADMPGVNREGLEISLERNELTLLGRRRAVFSEATHYRESQDGDFRRVFELNPEIDTDKITARVENGVLTLLLAKREQVKPRRIAITN
jgi:HSP20 family protein